MLYFCLFKKRLECYGCYSSDQISFEGFHARSMETWDTSLGILINKRSKDAYGEEFSITFSGLSLVLSRADLIRQTPEQVRIANFPGDNNIHISSVLNASYCLVLVSSTNLIGKKKQFVTSTRATEKKLENQVSLEGIAVLMRPYWLKQLSTASVKFCFYCRKYSIICT